MNKSLPNSQDNENGTQSWQGKNASAKQVTIDPEQPIRRSFEVSPNEGMAMLFKRYYPQLCSHALRFVASKAVAEDLVSDIFFEFHSQSIYLNVQSSYRAYLFASVRHRAFDYVRREMKRQTSLDSATMIQLNEAQSPDSITQYEDLYHDVQNVINAMPIKRRQIYLMNRFEGKNSLEIADKLSISARTVETHLYQAVRQLREALRDKWLAVMVFWFINL